MRSPKALLSAQEARMLLQIKLQAAFDPKQRGLIDRLIHFGLVEETPRGVRLSSTGETRCREEATRLGLT